MNNALKFAAIGGAAWFLFGDYLRNALGMDDDPPMQAQPLPAGPYPQMPAAPHPTTPQMPSAPAPAGSGSGTPAPAPTGVVPALPTTPAAPALTWDQKLRLAAVNASDAGLTGSSTLNWHQWNWYRREQNPSLPVPAPEDVGMGDGSQQITAAQYHSVLASSGLRGIRFAAWGR